MSSTPANAQGLASFKRAMVTRFAGTCNWCSDPTTAGVDYAFLGGDGKWAASCVSCSVSVPSRIAGIARRIGKVQDQLTEAQLATLTVPAGLADAIGGTMSDHDMVMMTVEMMSLARTVEDLVTAGQPKPRTGRPNRYSGKCVNCDFQVAAGAGLYANGVCSHVVCPTFDEWCMDTYGALPGSPELREIAVAHAHATSNCIFCATELTHPDSDPRQGGVGYGPVCAVKYGLPHGGSQPRKAKS